MNVPSFTINHDLLQRGIYVSRKDIVGGEIVTTFDVRMKNSNKEPVMEPAAIHTLEHLLAVFLRGHKNWASKTLYVGPMGCRTGMYIIFIGDYDSADVLDVIKEAFQFVIHFSGTIPGAGKKDCGNYLDHNLEMAKWESRKYLEEILSDIKQQNMIYPQ